MKKKVALLCLFFSFVYGQDKATIIKPRVKRIQKTTGDIKQAIAKECDSILTSCLTSINCLTECIDVVRKKIKALVSSDDDFYSKKKACELEKYKAEIIAMRKTLETIEIRLDKEIEHLDTNFSK